MAITLDVTRDLAPKCLMTVRIVGIRKWQMRMWLATKIIKLASMIMNIGIKFEKQPYYKADL